MRALSALRSPALAASRRAVAAAAARPAAAGEPPSMAPSSILWFRKGLRLHDNPALLEAAAGVEHMYPIFILDPHFLNPAKVGANRIQFLIESLADLDAGLRARGSRLLVLRGAPTEVLPRALAEWGAAKLCFERDFEPYALERDTAARAAAAAAGAAVHAPASHTLYDLEALAAAAGGKAPLTMQSFQKLLAVVGPPPPPAPDAPAALPGPAPGAWSCAPAEAAVPSLAACGYPADGATAPFRGGEGAALARMAAHLADKDWVCAFEKPKGNPAAFSPRPATTVLSPYLKFGCLSARTFHAQLLAIYAERKGKHTEPPVSLRGQLLWREFFCLVGAMTPNYDRMAGSPICRQIPWEDNAAFLAAWEAGATGFPWIDAIMNQLRRDGWMHHLARHAAACFLTRGDLWCSWEAGRDVFDKYLLDADWALNTGNWLWLSASAFFSQYFRCYSPVSFGKQYDKEGAFIREYVPALRNFPAKYIFE
jgi:cryptochrome